MARLKVTSYQLESLHVKRRKTGTCWLLLVDVFLYFSIAGKVNEHYVLNAKADEFVPRFSTTSDIGTEKIAKLERGYVLYFISTAHLGRYSYMRTN